MAAHRPGLTQALDLIMKFLALIALVALPLVSQAQSWQPESCKSALLAAYTTMEPLPASDHVESQTQGDYNSDKITDVAILLKPKRDTRKQSIGVCLSNVRIPVLINYAYVPNHIFTKRKGTRYNDYDLGQTRTFDRDVISVNDNACCGASYILRGGVFVEIVDSD